MGRLLTVKKVLLEQWLLFRLLECHGGIIWDEMRKESYGSGTCKYHEWED